MHLGFFQILKPNNRKVAPAPVESWQGLQQLEPRLLLSGTITAWGDDVNGGSGAPSDSGYTQIFSTDSAFAALKSDGSITAWGYDGRGGSGAPTDSGYVKIVSANYAFAALKADGSITAWGRSDYGGSGAPTRQRLHAHLL